MFALFQVEYRYDEERNPSGRTVPACRLVAKRLARLRGMADRADFVPGEMARV